VAVGGEEISRLRREGELVDVGQEEAGGSGRRR
jgi:hypothetical protein